MKCLYMKQVGTSYLSIMDYAKTTGDHLIAVKKTLKHGDWKIWLKEEWRESERTARVYMRMAKNWHTIKTCTSIAEALAKLKRIEVLQ